MENSRESSALHALTSRQPGHESSFRNEFLPVTIPKSTEKSLSAIDRAKLRKIASTGIVPRSPAGPSMTWRRRLAQAEQLFLLKRDLVPILILLIALTGRNVETLKDLPANTRSWKERPCKYS